MLLILLAAFVFEDNIEPSLRLSALGSDFTILIEDALADVQFNPAQLGNLSRSSIYFRPEWSSYWLGGGKINAVTLFPKVYGNVCVGLLSSYSYSNYHTVYVYEYWNYDYSNYDTSSTLQKDPAISLLVAFPFLRSGGFFGISGTVKRPNRESTRSSYHMSSDSSYNADTSYYHRIRQSFHRDVNKSTVWLIKGGQYLPIGTSIVNVVASVAHSEPETAHYDTIFEEQTRMNIAHYDSTRYMYYLHSITDDYDVLIENYDVWQYSLGLSWEKDITEGHVRLFFEGALQRGEITQQQIRRDWHFNTYLYEYSSPDTTYSEADTSISEDADKDVFGVGDFSGDIEAIGFGLEKAINEYLNIAVGTRVRRAHNDIESTIHDTVQTAETEYKAIVPLGAEIHVTKKFIVRGGIDMSYTHRSTETITDGDTDLTDSYLDVNWSFGLGLDLTPHLRVDLYNAGYDFSSIYDWRLECIYSF